jgi:hypothetical protein
MYAYVQDFNAPNVSAICVLLAGIWIDRQGQVMYGMASKITFICQMNFNAFPVDIQVCASFLQTF